MPKLGAEPIRKAALINAAIATVARAGSLEVTVAEIARAAGMSPALAHHYFGSKEQMFLAAMRHILTAFGASVRSETAAAESPRTRLDAILRASFGPQNFEHGTVAAWLTFYALARTSPEAGRLLRIYHCRLRSNLRVPLRGLTPEAEAVADRLGALIDGIYLRAALAPAPADGAAALALARGYLDEALR
ncbi:transcriptional regulator BetI [Paracoccus sp. S-4012]|uniref:choline-binding transcriptional repressor BetI n=1 Tax=Paracoccus sp. S-4012 TaxID=2665648 RepID=UPI0012B053F1|nr:transcriptional regulator BetI [Paracoccus sp. S-4012]MRX50025.1 transcriptional regulator BetI [Paracoccus sp. S-4012]